MRKGVGSYEEHCGIIQARKVDYANARWSRKTRFLEEKRNYTQSTTIELILDFFFSTDVYSFKWNHFCNILMLSEKNLKFKDKKKHFDTLN